MAARPRNAAKPPARKSEEGFMARYAYVNGRYVDHRQATVHIEDRGYQLADGVYEAVGVRDGRLLDEGPHFDRRDRPLRQLRHARPHARATLAFVTPGRA